MPHECSHNAAQAAASPVATRRRCVIGCLLALVAPTVGGCAMSFPMASLMPGDDVTASNSPIPFGRLLVEEDRRREVAALATALDPQGDGATVKWDNAASGHRGAITAVGKAYNSGSKVCRAFSSEMSGEAIHRKLQGHACAVAAGEWKVIDAEPAKG